MRHRYIKVKDVILTERKQLQLVLVWVNDARHISIKEKHVPEAEAEVVGKVDLRRTSGNLARI